jgi:Cu+-exporting ATPase
MADGHAVVAGRRGWIEDQWALPVPALLLTRAAEAEAAGQTAVFAAWDGQVRGVLVAADTIKPTSAQAVARLREMGLRPVLLTGDNPRAARAVAAQAGIGEVIAGVPPAAKADTIRQLQASGQVVAMAGDGVNDAAALAQADLGLAMGTGTDAAIEAADLTLVRGDLLAVPDAIRLSRRTLRTIKGNLFWAFAYNAAAIPLAALGFLNPLIAAAAMAFSSVFVVSNSLRLRRFQPGAAQVPPPALSPLPAADSPCSTRHDQAGTNHRAALRRPSARRLLPANHSARQRAAARCHDLAGLVRSAGATRKVLRHHGAACASASLALDGRFGRRPGTH